MKQSLIIRGAEMGDVKALAELLGELGFPVAVSELDARLERLLASDELVLVAQRDAQVLGLVSVHVTPVLHRPTPVGRMTALVVAEHARGQGIGRALVEEAERLLAGRGCALVEVTSNVRLLAAHAFYQHLGYELTSLRFKKSIGSFERRTESS